MTHAVIHICETCAPETAAGQRNALQRSLDVAGVSAQVRMQACMNACDRPVSLSLQADGFATYFFTGVAPETDRQDIVATVRHYLASPRGWIENAERCGRLRFCLAGRVPSINSAG